MLLCCNLPRGVVYNCKISDYPLKPIVYFLQKTANFLHSDTTLAESGAIFLKKREKRSKERVLWCMLWCKLWHTFCADDICTFWPLKSARKIKNIIRCRFFASFERAVVSDWLAERCGVLSKSVQFLLRQNPTYRETLHGNSYAFTG